MRTNILVLVSGRIIAGLTLPHDDVLVIDSCGFLVLKIVFLIWTKIKMDAKIPKIPHKKWIVLNGYSLFVFPDLSFILSSSLIE